MRNLSQYSIGIHWCKDIPYFEIYEGIEKPEKIVIYLHGFTSSTEDNLPSILHIARKGFTVIGIDMQYHGIRKLEGTNINSICTNHIERCILMIKTCTDVRKVIDHLFSIRPKYERLPAIGVFGVSMGGMMAYLLAIIEKRITAIAPTISTPDWNSGLLWVKRILNAKKITYLSGINPATNIECIYPTPILIQNGKRDKVIPVKYTEKHLPIFKKCYKGAEEKLVYVLHNCGHELITPMVENAAKWFRKTIN